MIVSRLCDVTLTAYMANPFIIVRDIFSVSSGDEDLTDPDNTFLSESASSIEEG